MKSRVRFERRSKSVQGVREPTFQFIALLLLLALMSACAALKPPEPPPDTHYRSMNGDELASIHLATVLIWPWDNVSHSIQPTFKVNVDSPESAIVVTSSSSSGYRQSNTLDLGVSFAPPLPAEATKSPEQAPGEGGSSDLIQGGSSAPPQGASGAGGNSSKGSKNASSGAAPPANKSTGSQPSQASLGLADAITQLDVTNALFQEAGLLNNFTNGLMQRQDYIPYVIRLQVTVLPKHRQEPYDLFLNLGFSLTDGAAAQHVPKPIIVVPLLVTDSIEASHESISVDLTSALQAQLSAGVSLAKANAELKNTVDIVNSALSNRQNSLFSIGKVDDTTLVVRVGANRFGNDFELEPKTHSISFVMLISRFLFTAATLSKEIQITARPIYQDALSTNPKVSGVEGPAVPETFVLESTPAITTSSDRAFEVWCPPAQTVAVTESSNGVQGVIYGVRDWGNRSVIAFLSANVDNQKSIDFASAQTFRTIDGTIPLRFGPIAAVIGKTHVASWDIGLHVSKLRTDASYYTDPQGKQLKPWVDCGDYIDAVFIPAPPSTKDSAAVPKKAPVGVSPAIAHPRQPKAEEAASSRPPPVQTPPTQAPPKKTQPSPKAPSSKRSPAEQAPASPSSQSGSPVEQSPPSQSRPR
jgi:hypothetical protein